MGKKNQENSALEIKKIKINENPLKIFGVQKDDTQSELFYTRTKLFKRLPQEMDD